MSVTDAKQPDPQAACELAVQLQMAVEMGVHLVQGPHSMMDQMMLSSFTQMVINDDIAGYVLAGHRPLRSQTRRSRWTPFTTWSPIPH